MEQVQTPTSLCVDFWKDVVTDQGIKCRAPYDVPADLGKGIKFEQVRHEILAQASRTLPLELSKPEQRAAFLNELLAEVKLQILAPTTRRQFVLLGQFVGHTSSTTLKVSVDEVLGGLSDTPTSLV